MEIKLVENVVTEMKRDVATIKKGIYKNKCVMTPETFSKVFSPQRMRLLMKLQDESFESISELALTLNRKFESVHRDIAYLSGIGIIVVKKEKKNVIPMIDGRITLPVI